MVSQDVFVLGDATIVKVYKDNGVTKVDMTSMGSYSMGHCPPQVLGSELRLCADRYDALQWITGLQGGLGCFNLPWQLAKRTMH